MPHHLVRQILHQVMVVLRVDGIEKGDWGEALRRGRDLCLPSKGHGPHGELDPAGEAEVDDQMDEADAQVDQGVDGEALAEGAQVFPGRLAHGEVGALAVQVHVEHVP